MSFTYSAGGAMPLPNLAWDFNGTTTPYIGSATTSVTGSVSYSAGKYIQAVNIVNTPTGTPGTGANYITWTNYGTFNPSVGVTACFWINVNALPASGQQSIALWMRGSAVNSAVYINLTPTNWSPFYTDGTNYYGPTSSTPLSTGVWYHLTVVVGGGTVTGYQNGVQIASPVAFSNPLDVSGFLYIGGSGNFGPTSALYDDLRIYNSALTVAQVQSIYNQQGMPGRGVGLVSATGGDTVQYINGYRIHTFTTTGTQTFTVSGASITGAQILVVAGGGGGGQTTRAEGAGGGGAGGLVYVSSTTLTAGSYTITVGAGGGVGAPGVFGNSGLNGGNSSFSTTYVALGGGGGGAHDLNGVDGGSGGGAGGTNVSKSPGGATQPGSASGGFGNAGGANNTGANYAGGGGGGAGAAGSPSISGSGPTSCGGPGGIGRAYSISGTSTYYAGGGAGGDIQTNSAAGGLGGGGAGAKSGTNAQPGTPNTGGGGGGAGSTTLSAAAGGSGIVIIAYPSTGASTMSGTPLFSQISTAASSSAVGAFSLRAVNGTSAKAVQVRNGTTSATQDFYADRLGNLLTAPVVGQSLAKWLGGATGYVATWYDQSGKGSHMSCSSTALQPKIDLVNKWIDFKTTAYFDVSATPSTGPVPWDNTKNYTVLCRHNSIGNNLGGLFGVSNAAPNFNTTSYTNNFRRDTAGYQNYWYFKDFSAGTYAIGNKVTWKWDGTNRYMYTNGTLNATQSQLSTDWLQTSSSGQVIGAQTVTGAGNYMNGEMYSIFMFNSALSDTDRLLVENY